MVMVMVMVKIDEQGRIIIPKELREKKKLIGEIEIEEIKDGLILRSKKDLTWRDFFKEKLKINWKKTQKLDLSEETLDDLWL